VVTLLPFFIILVAGILFSLLFARLHLPWVIAMIVAGIVVGPFGAGLFTPDATFEFLGQVGLVFLMFMAGLETRLSSFREFGKGILVLSLLSSLIPAVIGFTVMQVFSYDLNASILVGIIFISSSIAVALPSMDEAGLLRTNLGKSTVAAVVVNDVMSLILLSVFLQLVDPTAVVPLPLFYLGLVIVLFGLRWAIPEARAFMSRFGGAGNAFEKEVRSIVVILLGTVALFEVLGVHPITAAFFAGLILSESIKSDELREKLHGLSYGVFIPVFFVTIGAQTNLALFFEARGALELTIIIILVSVVAKFFSGYIGARASGFDGTQGTVAGAAMIPQLSTTLAVVFTARALGLLDNQVQTALIILSIVTTFVGPFLISRAAEKLVR